VTGVLGRPGSNGVMLLCLDALDLSADSDAVAPPPQVGWSRNAARLLSHAREHGWSVGHAISRRPRPGETPWRPLSGLAPEPSEPVYHREGPSAFSSLELCAALDGGARPEVVLCGVSVRGSGLATVLDAHNLKTPLTIVGDAAWLPQAERDGLDGLLQLQRMGMVHSCVRLTPTEALVRPGPRLRVLQGGRR
jgi:hypothetical protein